MRQANHPSINEAHYRVNGYEQYARQAELVHTATDGKAHTPHFARMVSIVALALAVIAHLLPQSK